MQAVRVYENGRPRLTESGLPILAEGAAVPPNAVLREDGSYELREDGSRILREN